MLNRDKGINGLLMSKQENDEKKKSLYYEIMEEDAKNLRDLMLKGIFIANKTPEIDSDGVVDFQLKILLKRIQYTSSRYFGFVDVLGNFGEVSEAGPIFASVLKDILKNHLPDYEISKKE